VIIAIVVSKEAPATHPRCVFSSAVSSFVLPPVNLAKPELTLVLIDARSAVAAMISNKLKLGRDLDWRLPVVRPNLHFF
jgi:hypothetical protein